MMLFNALINKLDSIALVGLGYVDMPIGHAFAKKDLNVIGFDLNKEKIELYKSVVEPTKEVGDGEIKNMRIHFTTDETELKKAKMILVSVSTPMNNDHTPDLTPVIGASKIVGRNFVPGFIVVYEPTVYHWVH